MATNGPSLLQQKASLETRIKLLVNNDLKEICREYHYQVSGTKATLQKRVIEGEIFVFHVRRHLELKRSVAKRNIVLTAGLSSDERSCESWR
jgi:hypothetical protein